MSGIIKEKNYNAINIVIGVHIQKLRDMHKLTQDEFAKKINMSRANLTNVENGVQLLSLKKIYEICEVFNMNIHDMLPSVDWYSKNKNKRIVKKITIEIID